MQNETYEMIHHVNDKRTTLIKTSQHKLYQLMYFSIRIRTIFAAAGSLAILTQCNAVVLAFGRLGSMDQTTTAGNRQLIMNTGGYKWLASGTVVIDTYGGSGSRTLTSVEEAKDEGTQHSLHINATGLPTNCVGCTVAIALIQTYCVAQPMHMIVH
eukprot:scaffold9715_cov102-Skeletonema_marinoi.AAC.2